MTRSLSRIAEAGESQLPCCDTCWRGPPSEELSSSTCSDVREPRGSRPSTLARLHVTAALAGILTTQHSYF